MRTMSKRCDSAAPEGCVPGCCDQVGNPNWCDDVRLESQSVYQCAFRPTDLDAMLRHHEMRPGSYNEVIIDPGTWSATTVEAFYFQGDGEEAARRIHADFHARNPGSVVPLVRLELQALERPFVRVA